jgi:prevent-host-death family protein
MAQTIPQRELRNRAGSVLRRAEQGERFTITVNGRPVAQLGPLPGARTPAPPERLAAVLTETPVDDAWSEELRKMREDDRGAAREPWPD